MSKKKKKKNKKPQKTRQDFGYSKKADNKEIFHTQDQVEDEAKEDKKSLPSNEEKEGLVWRVLNKIVISIIETIEFINEKWRLILVSIILILMVVLGVYLAFGTESVNNAVEFLKEIDLAILYLDSFLNAIVFLCGICYLIYLFFKSRPKSNNWFKHGLYIFVFFNFILFVDFIIKECEFDKTFKKIFFSIIFIASFAFLSKSFKCLITEKKGCFGWGFTIFFLYIIVGFIIYVMKEL